jgi:hypothetical protein
VAVAASISGVEVATGATAAVGLTGSPLGSSHALSAKAKAAPPAAAMTQRPRKLLILITCVLAGGLH